MILTVLEHREHPRPWSDSSVVMGVFTTRELAREYLIAVGESQGWFAMYNQRLDPPVDAFTAAGDLLEIDLQFYSVKGEPIDNPPEEVE